MPISPRHLASVLVLAGALNGCGGSGSPAEATGTPQPQAQAQGRSQALARIPVLLSDASSRDWAMVGIKVLSIDLLPQAGGTDVRVASSPRRQ
jgi:hypothetical protein